MFRIQEDNVPNGVNGDIYRRSGSTDPIRITVNSSDGGSSYAQSNNSNVDPSGVQRIANATLPLGQSIFQPRLSGYGHSTNIKPPMFDNDVYKYVFFKNKLNHYLLMLGIYSAISDTEISETADMDLYLAIANCLSDSTLDLVSTQAFGQGQKAYRLLNQKFLGNTDAREARTMIDITNILQLESENLNSYLDRFEVLKSRLDEFKTINKCSFFTILCIKGLHPKYATFKDIITTGKTPTWELFKERVESHAAMMSISSDKTSKILHISSRDSPNKVGQTYNTQVTQFCKRCLGRNHVSDNCFSKKFCNKCKNASHNTYECSFINQNVDYNTHINTQEKSYSQNTPHFSHRGNQSQNRGRGNTPKRPHFNTSKRSPTGRPLAQRGRRSINNVTRQKEIFSTANVHYRNPEDTPKEYQNDQEPVNYAYDNTSENESSDVEYEPQMPNNVETEPGRTNFNNLFI